MPAFWKKVELFEKQFSFYHSFTPFAENAPGLPRQNRADWEVEVWLNDDNSLMRGVVVLLLAFLKHQLTNYCFVI